MSQNRSISEIAHSAAHFLFEKTVQYTRTAWRPQVKQALQISIPDYVITACIFEMLYAGEMIMRTKARSLFDQEDVAGFARKLHQSIVMLLAESFFESEGKHDMGDHYEEVEDMYNEFRQGRIKAYQGDSNELPALLSSFIMESIVSQELPLPQQVVEGYIRNLLADFDEYQLS